MLIDGMKSEVEGFFTLTVGKQFVDLQFNIIRSPRFKSFARPEFNRLLVDIIYISIGGRLQAHYTFFNQAVYFDGIGKRLGKANLHC